MRSLSRKQTLPIAIVIAAFLLACNALMPGATPASTQVVVPTEFILAVTETNTPWLSQQLTLTSIPFNESNPGNGYPKYTINSQTPQLTGSDDPRLLAFNQRLNDMVANEVNTWRQNFQQLPLTPLSNGSSLDVTYTLLGQKGDVWSFKFDFSFYADTAAHPGLNMITINYDLAAGRELTLNDLFLPSTNYLDVISAYCIAELQKQPYADSFWLEGANPKVENYQLWNITSEGLTITFGEYQVAPYAAGPQTVVVPYTALDVVIDPQGPLAAFLP